LREQNLIAVGRVGWREEMGRSPTTYITKCETEKEIESERYRVFTGNRRERVGSNEKCRNDERKKVSG